jgi:hypothetical protein
MAKQNINIWSKCKDMRNLEKEIKKFHDSLLGRFFIWLTDHYGI